MCYVIESKFIQEPTKRNSGSDSFIFKQNLVCRLRQYETSRPREGNHLPYYIKFHQKWKSC